MITCAAVYSFACYGHRVTANQASEIYEGLAAMLRKSELSWIVDEVETVVAEGKTEVEERQPPQNEERSTTRRRRKGVAVHAQRGWTDEERLALLLDATDAALCGPALMATDLVSVLPEWESHMLEFEPGGNMRETYPEWRRHTLELAARGPEVEGDVVTLDGAVVDRVAVAKKLSVLLQSVREELDADID